MKKNEEKYLKAYMGENYKKIKKNQFSIITLIFGPLHLIYKRMYILGIILLGVLGITFYYNKEVGLLLTIITNLILAYKYNSLYYEHAKKKIDEICISNPNKTEEELEEICKQKGKPFIALVLFIIFFFMIAFSLIPYLFIKEDNTIEDIKENKIHDLSYQIPKGFQLGSYSSKEYISYHYQKEKDHCIINIKVSSNTNIKQYVTTYYKEDYTTLQKEVINNWNWRRTDKNYIIEINNLVYDVYYEAIDNSSCSKLKEEFISSLDFPNIDQ